MATRRSGTGTTTNSYDYDRPTKNRTSEASQRFKDSLEDQNWIAWAVFLGLIAIALRIMAVNVIPYFILFGSPVPAPSNIPLIGWGWDLLVILYMGFGATIAWAIVNSCQVLWILIFFDSKAARGAAKEAERTAQSFGADGNPDLRRVKRRAIKLPFFFQVASGYLALAAFTFEAFVSFRAYPPFKDFTELLAGIQIGDWSIIDWGNVLSQLWCVFSTEFIVIAILVVAQWIYYSRKGSAYS